MSIEFWIFMLAVMVSIGLLFTMVWHLICVDELKSDYRNPMDFCKTLNRLVIPEYGIHLTITLILLVYGLWISAAINIPLIIYHIWRYMRRPVMSGPGLYDPTEVMNKSNLDFYTREGFIKCGFYVISFLIYLYNMLVALVQSLT